jgi:hypothetical protein
VIIAAAAAVAALAMAAVRRILSGPLLADPGRGTTMIAVAGTRSPS